MPSQMSRTPTPVTAPRTKLLARKARSAGYAVTSALSCQRCGSQGTAMSTRPTSTQKATKTSIMLRAIHTGMGGSSSCAGTTTVAAGNERTFAGTEGSFEAGERPSGDPDPGAAPCRLFCAGSMPRWILRLQCFDALRDVAVVDVRTVNFHEAGERFLLVAGGFVRRRELVVNGHAALVVDVLHVQRLLIPLHGRHGHALLDKAVREPGVRLHDLRERMPALDRLADFLQLADGFIEQAHLFEGDAEVVMGIRTLGLTDRRFGVFLELGEHIVESVGGFLALDLDGGGRRRGGRGHARGRLRS